MQHLPSTARRYSSSQRTEITAATRAVKRVWRRMGDDFDASFTRLVPDMLAITTLAQQRVASEAVDYVPAVLEETGQSRYAAPAGTVTTEAFVGVDGSGRPVENLLNGAVVRTKQEVARGATVAVALHAGSVWLTTATGTMLSDTARAAETVQMGNHRTGGYIRMLNPPSCSRCAVIASRWFADSQAFQRHPGCDCRHIPASEAVGDDMRLDVRDYFDSLSTTEQDRIFTKAGAEAIRNGADPALVVNARRGMSRAQSGRLARNPDVWNLYTTYSRPYGYKRTIRLMPESIRDIATDKADYIRLLRVNGYIR